LAQRAGVLFLAGAVSRGKNQRGQGAELADPQSQVEFVALDMDKYLAQAEAHRLGYLTREAKKLGYQLIEIEQAA